MYLNDIITDIINTIVSSIENYGWYLLLCLIVFVYIYHSYLKSYINDYMKWKDEKEYSEKYHKNPDLFVARQVAQQQAAMKLQEKYNREAEEHRKKLEEREAKKREEAMQKFDGQGGQKLGSESSKQSFKPDYNPLMGSGSGSSYRPPRRSACSRGGCG
ncbi:hypothetical protein NQ317_015086 [Molorchus minor]|uniref:Selenoprotein S n=1 Tax=Molorchus minor TaxID=1323400 RepID=A0ABQ9K7V2_9CUCU|nr:hypothetical protein NQ317_015086 [Molorchus minor]